MSPDRRYLQSVSQKNKESFKEYAQTWREFASQVEPPLIKKLVQLFMDIIQPAFCEKMIGSTSMGFSELVTIGAWIEHGLRNGKITVVSRTSNSNPKKFSIG